MPWLVAAPELELPLRRGAHWLMHRVLQQHHRLLPPNQASLMALRTDSDVCASARAVMSLHLGPSRRGHPLLWFRRIDL